MKNKMIIYIFVLFSCIGAIAGIYCYNKLNQRTYNLNLPEKQNISSIGIEQNAIGFFTKDIEYIDDILNVLNDEKRITKKESIQDSPTDVESEIKVDFYINEGNYSTIFLYKKNFKYYIEQPYNGIYRISADEYNAIEKYIKIANSNTSSTEPYIPDGLNVSNVNEVQTSTKEEKYNRSPENVTIKVLKDTISSTGLSIIITDNNKDYYGWGVDFKVQKKIDEKWETLEPISDDLTWIGIAYVPNEDNQVKQKLNIENYYGKLGNGIYRIVKTVYDKEYIDLYSNEFEIK